jgi:hypothetical protein
MDPKIKRPASAGTEGRGASKTQSKRPLDTKTRSAKPALTTRLTPAQLDALARRSPPWLEPVWAAVRNTGVVFTVIDQNADPFDCVARSGRPSITLVCDDIDKSCGPSGFHQPSLESEIRRTHGVIVVSCAPLPEFYSIGAYIARMGLNALIIDTRPAHEIQWVEFVRSARPGLPILIGSVKGALQ